MLALPWSAVIDFEDHERVLAFVSCGLDVLFQQGALGLSSLHSEASVSGCDTAPGSPYPFYAGRAPARELNKWTNTPGISHKYLTQPGRSSCPQGIQPGK